MISAILISFVVLQQSQSIATRVDTVTFSGDIKRGEYYSRIFHDNLRFELVPSKYGWIITVSIINRTNEDISRLTPPFHSVPNPREIDGWHFRNETNTGPNDGSINAPDTVREFIFSPRVGLTINYPPSIEQVEQIKRDGFGILTIKAIELGNLVPNERADIVRMRFRVCMVISF
jgi:hypothetical protein